MNRNMKSNVYSSDINECASAPCVNGQCQDEINQYTCICEPGWTGINCDISKFKSQERVKSMSVPNKENVPLSYVVSPKTLCQYLTSRMDDMLGFLIFDNKTYCRKKEHIHNFVTSAYYFPK